MASPTQEQIEAALRYSACNDKRKDLFILLSYNEQASSYPIAALKILAAAYREKCEECEELKKELSHIADLLDAHFDNGGTIAGLGTTNKARKLLEPAP